MEVNIIKQHGNYPLGIANVTDERGHYLIKMGVAEEVKEKVEYKDVKEKVEQKQTKEKAEKR